MRTEMLLLGRISVAILIHDLYEVTVWKEFHACLDFKYRG